LECATGTRKDLSRRPVVLSIAGFDPSSGAGVTADLKVFAAFGLYGMACITALTVQSTQGVRRVEPVVAKAVGETLEMLAEDVAFAGIKVGMLGTGQVAAAVADFLESHPQVPIVLDPVLRSSSGRELIDAAGLDLIRHRLLGRVNWMTPNLDELAVLTGEVVVEREDMPSAAAKLRSLADEVGNTNLNILVTGGHLPAFDAWHGVCPFERPALWASFGEGRPFRCAGSERVRHRSIADRLSSRAWTRPDEPLFPL